MIKKYICECCGGQIDFVTLKCNYCGTQYKDENNSIIRIETFHNPIKQYTAECIIPEYIARKEDTSGYILNELAHQLARKLVENMDIQIAEDYDIQNMNIRVRGRVRVVVPEQRSDLFMLDKWRD